MESMRAESPVNALPCLTGSEVVAYVRFLLEWMDAEPRTVPGKIHHLLITHFDPGPCCSGDTKDIKSQEDGVLLAHIFTLDRLPAIVQWLSEGTTWDAVRAPCSLLLQSVMVHIMSDGPAEDLPHHHAVSVRVVTEAERLLSAVRSTQYRGPLVMLLFHSNEVVRIWSRETLLRLVILTAARDAKTASSSSKESERNEMTVHNLWLLAMQLLCAVKHITTVQLNLHESRVGDVLADGICSLLALLAVIDAKLIVMEGVPEQKQLFNNVSAATVLLLGGSMVLQWLFSVSSLPSTSGTASTAIAGLPAIESLAVALNARMGADTTLQPLSLAGETRRAFVKALMHCILSNAKRSMGLVGDEVGNARNLECMRKLWCVASHIDVSPTATVGKEPVINKTASSISPGKSAGWMLKFLMRNASLQLHLQEAVEGVSGGVCNEMTLWKMERAVHAIASMLTALADGIPELAASHYYHSFLKSIQKDVVAISGGVIMHTKQDPKVALTLLRHFMLMDLMAFSCGSFSHPDDCIRAVWEVLPRMLQRAVHPTVGGAVACSSISSSSLSSPLLLRVVEVLDVTTLQPSVCAWLLLKQLKDGPPPIACAVGKCLKRVTDILQGLIVGTQQLQGKTKGGGRGGDNVCNATTPIANVSNLISDGSQIPRIAHVLMMSKDVVMQRLGETISKVFLSFLSPVVHCTFRTDAANWLLQVILRDPVLRENFLKLQNAQVDAETRANGCTWALIMCECNWSNVPPKTLLASWWLSALLVDVCVMEDALRDRFLDSVVAQLPSLIGDQTVSPSLVSSLSSSSSISTFADTATATEINATTPAPGVTTTTDKKNSSSFSLLTKSRQPLRQCAKHLLLGLLQKRSFFTAPAFAAAVLHVASAFSPTPEDHTFKTALSKAFVNTLQMLSEEGKAMLTDYSPGWFSEILQSAQKTIEESVETLNRRIQLYEAEEKQILRQEELNRKQAEHDVKICRTNTELRQMELERQNQKTFCAPRVAGGNSGVKRRLEDVPLLMIAQTEDNSSSLVSQTLTSNQQKLHSRMRTEEDVTTVQPLSRKLNEPNLPTPLQKHLQHLEMQRVNWAMQAHNLTEAKEAIKRVAGNTNFLHSPPHVDDIIGHKRYCLSGRMPIIPQCFPATPPDGHALYVASFFPHIALELRHELHQKFEEMLETCRSRDLFSRKGGKGCKRSADSSGEMGSHHSERTASLSSLPPLSTWVLENTTAVVCADIATPNFMDTTQLNFSVRRHVTETEEEATLNPVLSEGDVAVILLPLSHVATVLPHIFGTECTLPNVWRALGCVLQVCLVTLQQPGSRNTILTVFTPSVYSSNSGPGGPMSVTFSHVLQPFFSAHRCFYVRRLAPLGPSLATVTALYEFHRKPFASTVLSPHLLAKVCRAYHRALECEVFSGDRWAVLSRGLLLHECLNEWQMRAIATVLFAAAPGWETGTLRAPLPLGSLMPPPPNLFIIEGPPGTGKTQSIALLVLNLLHYLTNNERRILLCAPSNCAVDESLLRVRSLARRLPQIGDLKLLRVGVRESVDQGILNASPPLFLDDCVEMFCGPSSSFSSTMCSMTTRGPVPQKRTVGSGPNRQSVRERLLHGAHVVCSTLGSLNQLQRYGYLFDVVIVDEASQGTEPDVLQALVLSKKWVVLVGDSKQLQPTVLCQESARCGLKRSLLQRLLQQGHRPLLLRTQYRMHPDICAFPNSYFYDGMLLTHSSVMTRRQDASSSALPLSDTMEKVPRFVFVDVHDGRMEWGKGHSLMNRQEADAVVTQMRRFRDALRLSTVEFARRAGIITFYRAQKYEILQRLSAEERRAELQVTTVDGFQGKEKDIIFISCVRAPHAAAHAMDDVATLGFVEDWHRINVSITRAKEFCIVFSHRQTFHDVAARRKRQQQAVVGLSDAGKSPSLTPGGGAGEEGKDSDGDVVEEVTPPQPKPDDDPLVIDQLLQYAACHPSEAAIVTNSRKLHLEATLSRAARHK